MDAIYVSPSSAASKRKATILYKGGLGNICVKHVYLIEYGTKKYAQYSSAVFVKYTEKGKRKPSGFVQTYRPYLVILEGWQDIEPQSLWGKSEVSPNGTIISTSQYSSFDERWSQDFEAANKLEKVIADYRDFDTMKSIASFPGWVAGTKEIAA